jgi:hypothetical protein
MQLVFILLILPFIYLLSLAAGPVVWIGGRAMMFAEAMREHFGVFGEYVFFLAIVVLVVYCFKSVKYLFFGLLPLLVVAALIGRW